MNDLVTKYKLQKVCSAKRRCFSNEGQRLIDAVTAASDEGKQRERQLTLHSWISLSSLDLPKVLEMIQEQLRKKEEVSYSVGPLLVVVGMLRPAGCAV